MEWTTPPTLHAAGDCEAFTEAARAAATTWLNLELERARRHVDNLGIALPPDPVSAATPQAPLWVQDGETMSQRDRVTLSDDVLVVAAEGSIRFVRVVPADTMRELAVLPIEGTPWAMTALETPGQLLVVARGQTEGADWTTVTRLDASALIADTSADVKVLSTETMAGTLRLVAHTGNRLRVVTSGRMKLAGLSTWPEEVDPHASPQQLELAFAQLASDNGHAIATMGLSDLVPPELSEGCDGGVFPETYLGAGWLMVADLAFSASDPTPSVQRLPIIGSYPALSANATSLAVAGTNWPYFWLFDDGDEDGEAPNISVQTELHLVTADGIARSTRVEGAPTGAHPLKLSDKSLVLATTVGSAYLGGNFKPTGKTSLTVMTDSLETVDTLEDVTSGEAVADILFTPSTLYVLPDAADSPVRLVACDADGMLVQGPDLPDTTVRQRVLPLDDGKVVVVGRPRDAVAMAAQVALYDTSVIGQPMLLGTPAVIGIDAGDVEVMVDVARIATLDLSDGAQLLTVPAQVTSNDTVTGYGALEPRMDVFELASDGLSPLGVVSHGDLADRGNIPLTCGDTVSERRITGGAVREDILYSVSTFGVLAHDLQALAAGPVGDTVLSYEADCAATAE